MQTFRGIATKPVVTAMLALLPIAMAGCAENKLPDLSLATTPVQESAQVEQAARPVEGAQKAGRPSGPAGAIAEARSLRKSGQKGQALARLEAAQTQAPGDLALTRERGLLLLEVGQIDKAEPLLRQAIDPARPDWRIHSALGAALSAKGRQQEAQMELAKALQLAPDEPAVLNNLALSYALDGKSQHAEQLLRRASGQRASGETVQRTRQNLALLLGLNGRIDEARTVSNGVLPPEHVAANVAFLREQAGDQAQVSSSFAVEPVKAASASAVGLPAPTYQLGGPPKAGR